MLIAEDGKAPVASLNLVYKGGGIWSYRYEMSGIGCFKSGEGECQTIGECFRVFNELGLKVFNPLIEKLNKEQEKKKDA